MFYCDECAKSAGWPQGFGKSYGPCELCKKAALCNDCPSYLLPDKPSSPVENIVAHVVETVPPKKNKNTIQNSRYTPLIKELQKLRKMDTHSKSFNDQTRFSKHALRAAKDRDEQLGKVQKLIDSIFGR